MKNKNTRKIRPHKIKKNRLKAKSGPVDPDYQFNEGRLATDRKWITAIDDRIEELEKKVGIPELRRLKQKTMYRWRND